MEMTQRELSTLQWARERLAHCERIAAEMTDDVERAGWLEDVEYWRDIVAILDARPEP